MSARRATKLRETAPPAAAALAQHRRGEFDDAEKLYREALAQGATDADTLGSYGVLACQTGRTDLAIELLERAVAAHPEMAWLRSNLGETYRRQGRLPEAIECLQRSVELSPQHVEGHVNLGNALRECGDLTGAVAHYRRALELSPSLREAHNNLGLSLHELGRLDEAVVALERAIEADPHYTNAYYNHGNLLCELGRTEAAIASFRRAAQLEPDLAEAHARLGACLRQCGRYGEAITSLRRAIRLATRQRSRSSRDGGIEPEVEARKRRRMRPFVEISQRRDRAQDPVAAGQHFFDGLLTPMLVDAHNELGGVLAETGKVVQAVQCYGRALGLAADRPDIVYNLGSTLKTLGRLTEAERHLRRAVALMPENADAHMNLGNALKDQGRISEAVACYRSALEVCPTHADAHSNLLLALNYSLGHSPGVIFDEHRSWAERQVGTKPARPRAVWNGRRRIRVGYVSPDFRAHSVAHFVEPVLRGHDRSRFRTYAYAQAELQDTTTDRLRKLADSWCDTAHMTDATLADRIRRDKIDVLVDLAGHTAGNRLRVFGLRPAPIQIAYIGYPNTTGLDAMDYRITDEWADPSGPSDELHTEALIRIEDGFLCYQPHRRFPRVTPPPVTKCGTIMFGSFNALPKLNADVVAAWATVLRLVPDSRLLLKSPSFEDQETRHRVANMFDEAGIGDERFTCHPFIPKVTEHLRMYEHVDIGLDPFPYNGTATTCEALWMGVPVITLVGERHAGRVGLSLLQQIGLPDLCAPSVDSYVDSAVHLAADRTRLVRLRAGLRNRMRTSPLCDEKRMTRTLEDMYEKLLREAADAGNTRLV